MEHRPGLGHRFKLLRLETRRAIELLVKLCLHVPNLLVLRMLEALEPLAELRVKPLFDSSRNHRPCSNANHAERSHGDSKVLSKLHKLGWHRHLQASLALLQNVLASSERRMNTWWDGLEGERFWMEVTDREDIGSDLRAPSHDDAGQENWRYSLFLHAHVGDIVLHYKKPAIVGFSRISGPSVPAEITWAARGTYARDKGTNSHERPGYRIPLSSYTPLNPPVTLQDLRDRRSDIEKATSEVQRDHKAPHYFPFELSANRELRLLQGYAFKVPASVVRLFPSMAPILSLASQELVGEPVAIIENQPRNPPWNRDELILALDVYIASGGNPPGKTSQPVVELSRVLGAMGRALGQGDAATYRNPNGVYMKLMNFRRFDPAFTSDGRVGLTRGNKDEEVVWNEFSGDRQRLATVASAIRSAVAAHSDDQELIGGAEPDFQEAEEGRVLTRLHRVRERNRKLVAACKERALKRHGRLSCAACEFDFKAVYGPSVEGFIEVHHTKPVHTLTEGSKTSIDDLALLCANCHRVVHSSRRWLSVAEVRALLARSGAAR